MCMQYSMLLLLVADYNLKVDCVSLSMYYDIKKKQTRMLLARMTRSEAFNLWSDFRVRATIRQLYIVQNSIKIIELGYGHRDGKYGKL